MKAIKWIIGIGIVSALLFFGFTSAKKKFNSVSQKVSKATTILDGVISTKEDIENLKDAKPLTNKELKNWLPKTMGQMKRTGFKAGTTGYANVSSIEGTYKREVQLESEENDIYDGDFIEKKLVVNIIDGAGPSASMMVAGLDMAAQMDVEQDNENKHIKAIKIDGIKAQQTFHKKKNETALQFVYGKRFGVMINGVNMDPEETWTIAQELNLDELVDLTE